MWGEERRQRVMLMIMEPGDRVQRAFAAADKGTYQCGAYPTLTAV
jgi:hypothetical protein